MGSRRAMLMTAQEKIATGLAAEDVPVRFNSLVPCANVEKRTIGLPPLPEVIDEETEINTRSWLGHEVGHLKYASTPWPGALMRDKVKKELSFELEDCRTDREMGEEYPGVKEDRRAGFDLIRPKLPANNVLKAALYVLYEQVKSYHTLDDSVKYWGDRVGDPAAAKVLRMLINAIPDQLVAARVTRSTAEVIDVAGEIKEIWKELFKGGGDGEGDEEQESDSKMNDGGMFGEKKPQKQDKQDEQKPGKQKQSGGESDEPAGDGDEDEQESEDEQGAGDGEESEDESEDESEERGESKGDEDSDEDGEESEGGESDESEDDDESGEGDESDEDGEESDDNENGKGGDGGEGDESEDGDKSEGGSDGESDSEPDSSGDEDDESEADAPSSQSSDADAERAMQDMVDDFRSISDSEQDELTERLGHDKDEAENTRNYDCPEGYIPYTGTDKICEIEPAESGLCKRGSYRSVAVSPAEFRAEVRAKLGTLQRRLMMDLMSRRRLWVHDREHGEIDDTQLARVPTGDKRIYKRKLKRPSLNIAVEVVLDMSGSMHGGKMYLCGQLGYILGETLALVRVPYEVVGFTTGCGVRATEPPVAGMYYHRVEPLELMVIKPFAITRRSDMLGRFYAAAGYRGGSTVEGEGVWWAAKRLAERSEQRKLLIVICDGGPCGGPAPTRKFEEHAGEVVRRIRKYGMETIHVGIKTSDPLRYVPEDTFVRYDGLDDLLTGFYSRLGSILRGEKRRNEEPVPAY